MGSSITCPVCHAVIPGESREELLQREVQGLRERLEQAEAAHEQAEAALQETQARFHAFLDNSPCVAFLKDPDDRFVYLNRRYRERFRNGSDDMLGKLTSERYPPEVAQRLRENDTAALRGDRAVEAIEEVPTPDGVLRSWLVFKFPVPDASGRRFLGGVAIDITERLATENALREKEELQRHILEAVPGGIVMVGPDGSIRQANAEAQRVLGLTWDELSRRFVADWEPETIWEDGRPCLAADYPVSKCLQTGEPQPPATIGVRRPDGQVSWAVYTALPVRAPGTGQAAGAVVTFLDVTERKRVEEQLRDNEEYHRLISELTSDYAYRCAVDPDGTFRTESMTEGFTRITGFSVEEMQARGDWATLIHPEDLEQAYRNQGGIFAGQRGVHELRILTRSGETRWIRYSTHPIWDAKENRVVKLFGAVKDITSDRRAAEQLQESAHRLQTLSHRLLEVQEEERRRLARELHDEIGQVLTGLKLTLEMAERLAVKEARRSLAEARGLVQELMSRVRDLSMGLRPTLLDDLGLFPALQWQFQRYTAQTGVHVNFAANGLGQRFSPEVETAAYRIVQESLTNVARHAAVREVAVRRRCQPDRLVIEVEDRGAGFDFEAIQPTGGTGGLTGMQERAALLGGRLTVQSQAGAGTRLTAELPLFRDGGNQANGCDDLPRR